MAEPAFVGRLEREMFIAFEAALQHKVATTQFSTAEELMAIVDKVRDEYFKYFDYCFQPEFKDMSRDEFLACIGKRH